MARITKKLTLVEIRKSKKLIVKNLHILLDELERATMVPNDKIWNQSTEEEWMDEIFWHGDGTEAPGVFENIDELTAKIMKERKNA
jgi:hypothetical protein